MSMSDPISDMITRIRNAQRAGSVEVAMPSSNMKLSVLKVLQEEGYIEGFDVKKDGNKSNVTVTLRYYQGNPVIEKIVRISKPGLRIYKRAMELPRVRAGMGIAIISTPKGVMSEKNARSQGLGGEVVCTVE